MNCQWANVSGLGVVRQVLYLFRKGRAQPSRRRYGELPPSRRYWTARIDQAPRSSLTRQVGDHVLPFNLADISRAVAARLMRLPADFVCAGMIGTRIWPKRAGISDRV